MGNARTDTTGFSKLSNRRQLQVMIDVDEYATFAAWCTEHGTTLTQRVRELIIEHNQRHRRPS